MFYGKIENNIFKYLKVRTNKSVRKPRTSKFDFETADAAEFEIAGKCDARALPTMHRAPRPRARASHAY